MKFMRNLKPKRNFRIPCLALSVASLFFWNSVFFWNSAVKADEKAAQTKELFGDVNFQNGFQVNSIGKDLGVLRLNFSGEELDPQTKPTWGLATHASKYDLTQTPVARAENLVEAKTPGQRVALEKNEQGETVLFLDVATDKEYDAPRTADKRWIHLLLTRDFAPNERAVIGELESLVFSCDARVVDWQKLMTDDEFNVNLHATQASVYFAIHNKNPKSPDYCDYIWFGVSFFDDRWPIQTTYVELDGDPKTIGTGKLIYRLGDQKTIDDLLGGVNAQTKEWVPIRIDLTRYVDDMLKAAQERGLLTQTTVDELAVVHFNFGWETPGTYRASLALKNIGLTATPKKNK